MHAFMLFFGIVLVSVGCSSGNASRDAQRDVRKETTKPRPTVTGGLRTRLFEDVCDHR